MLVGHDAAADVVAQDEVVELGQEPDRGRLVAARDRETGDVEQLAPTLVPIDRELRTQRLDLGLEPPQARPDLQVCNRRRAVRSTLFTRRSSDLDRKSVV